MKAASYPGLEVKLVVNGIALPEYDDNDAEKSTFANTSQAPHSRTYVEGVAGSNFVIQLSMDDQFKFIHCDIFATVMLDGKRAVDMVFHPPTTNAARIHVVPGAYNNINGMGWLRKFVLAELTTRTYHTFRVGIHSDIGQTANRLNQTSKISTNTSVKSLFRSDEFARLAY